MTSKQKTVTLTHPASGQKIEVVAGNEGVYVSQGWLTPDEAKQAEKPANS